MTTNKMRELRDIPNAVGFQFDGVTKDGRKVECVVVQRDNGTHTVSGCEYGELAGWFPSERQALANLLVAAGSNIRPVSIKQALASRSVPKHLKDAYLAATAR